ncbi:MAG: hypothetical protein PVF06_00690 [Gammaproteobacteria bacterium]|jgi:hypothetical protein
MKMLSTSGSAAGTVCETVAVVIAMPVTMVFAAVAHAHDVQAEDLEAQIKHLNRQLEQARAAADTAEQKLTAIEDSSSADIKLGSVTVGGAMRVNYVNGDYVKSGDQPQRGGNGGNFELDTFRINASLDHERVIGKFEYRWYNGYNMLHTGWVGYDFTDAGDLQVGVTRVPFGPGAYGVSQSWFFDLHYYLGLADDMDLGAKYLTQKGNWDLAFAYFISSEGNWNGASEDSARYSYDTVKWTSGLDANGDLVGAAINGYEEKNQFNLRAVYQMPDLAIPTNIGVSLQYGELDGVQAEDGDHWAASAHMVNSFNNFTLATQLTRYEMNIGDDNPLGTDKLIPMGAYDFAWPAATMAWLPAVSLSYKYTTTLLPWLDYVLPYLEYSSIIKDADEFNDSEMISLGAAWAHDGWYIYTDLIHSNGNLFIGNIGDDYSNIFDGVGDFGADGNDRWNTRFNINFGYYF